MKNSDIEREGLSVSDAAQFIGVSRPTVYALLNREGHPLPSINIGRRRIIPKTEILKWLGEETKMRTVAREK